ncbi:hypothetical protein F4802DRAFT_596311 [Xylaria palmicola]|nr:hypothetical protein F4802DRAFT_596311 [Xylaria palmicola]
MASTPSSRGDCLPRTLCGKSKPPAAFSKNQLQKWYNQKRNDRRNEVTPQNIGLSCSAHIAGQREIRCHGPCDLVMIVDRFSKRQRNDPEPWCITCTEWRTSFDGNDDSTEVEQQAANNTDGDDDDGDYDDDDYDDDDGFGGPYGGPNIVSDVIDRLQGYGIEDAGEGTTVDTISTTESVQISLWDADTTSGRSNSGSGNPAKTATGMHSHALQNQRMLAEAPTFSNSGRSASHLEGYAPATNNQMNRSMASMASSVPPHLRRRGGMNPSTQTPSSSSIASHSVQTRLDREHVKQQALTLANRRQASSISSGCKPDATKRESKWYKGDNRKVFPGNKKPVAAKCQDGLHVPHDSDSPDEM